MKRYTVTFQPMGSATAVNELQSEAEQVLMRLHPRITYKMGQAFEGADGKLLVEFTADGNRLLLDEAFINRAWVLPVQFESLHWGWMAENEEGSGLSSDKRSVNNDPLAGVPALDGAAEFNLRKQRLHGRYIALMVSAGALILILIGNVIYPKAPVLMVLYAVVFAIFMFTLSDTPVDFRVYGEKIKLQEDGLEVSFWLTTRPSFFKWGDVWGVDYRNHICKVLSKTGKMRFLLSDRFGCQEQSAVLKAIVTRAGLRFVEGTFRYLIYRKPDA